MTETWKDLRAKRDAHIAQLVRDGSTIKDAAAAVGVSWSTGQAAVKAAGVKPVRRGHRKAAPSEHIAKFEDVLRVEVANGGTVRSAATRMGISQSGASLAARRWFPELHAASKANFASNARKRMQAVHASRKTEA